MSLLNKPKTKQERTEAVLRANCKRVLETRGESLEAIEGIIARIRRLPNTATSAEVSALYADLSRFKEAVGTGGEGGSGFYNLVGHLRHALASATEQIAKEDAEAEAKAQAEEAARQAAIAAKEARRQEALRLKALRDEFPDEFE